MKVRIKLGRDSIIHFFLIQNILSLIACFVNIRLGVISSLFIMMVFCLSYTKKYFLNDIPFIIYLIANLVSILAYGWNERPISIYVAAISFNVVPSFLYYIGKYAGYKLFSDKVLYCMLDAFIFMMMVGTVTYLFIPSFYYSFLGQSVDSFMYGLADYRYGSFISSLALGSVCTISVCLYFAVFDYLTKLKRVLYLPVILLNMIMCMQRSSWLVTMLCLFLCLLVRFWHDRNLRVAIIGIFILLIGFVVVLWSLRANIFTQSQLLYFERRLTVLSLKDMIASRSMQWQNAIEIFIDNPFGFGLGSVGQKANPYGLAIVTDGNHFRILTEIGIIGFIAFLHLNVRAIRKGIKEKRYYLALLILGCNIAAIGSPIFDQFYSSFAYWFVLGIATTSADERFMYVKGT